MVFVGMEKGFAGMGKELAGMEMIMQGLKWTNVGVFVVFCVLKVIQ